MAVRRVASRAMRLIVFGWILRMPAASVGVRSVAVVIILF